MGVVSGIFTVTRNDAQSKPLSTQFALDVNYTLGGTAVTGTDYDVYVGGKLASITSVNGTGTKQRILRIPANIASVAVEIRPKANVLLDLTRSVTFTVGAPTPSTQTTIYGVNYTPPTAYSVKSSQTTDEVDISDKPTVFLSQATADRTVVLGSGRAGGLTFNRQGSGLADGMVVPITLTGLGKYGVDYWLYQDATTRSPRLPIHGSMVFPAGITSVHVSVVPIVHAGTATLDPVIVMLNATSYYQYPSSTFRGVVNIVRTY